MSRLGALVAALFTTLGAAPLLAQEVGVPHNWGLGFQQSVTPIGDQMHSFHNMLLTIITAVTVLVLVLLVMVQQFVFVVALLYQLAMIRLL